MTDISKKDVTKRSRNGRAIKSLVSAGGISPSGGAGSGGFWVKNDVGISYSGYDDGAGGITPANVGIGQIYNPYKLTVIGSAYVEDLYLVGGYNIYMPDTRTSATSGSTYSMGIKFSDYSGEMASIMAIHNGYFGSTPRKLQFTVSNKKAMTIDYLGNVGIGTSTPQSKLTIQSNGIGGSEGVQLRNTNYPLVYLYEGSANDGAIQILSAGSAKVLINALGNSYFLGGNVGIGTSALDTDAILDTVGVIRFKSSDNLNSAHTWFHYSIDGSTYISTDQNLGTGAANIVFRTVTTTNAYYTMLAIHNNGALSFRNGAAFLFPTVDGTSGQILTTNGSGTLYWSSGGGGTPSTGITSINSQAQSAQFIEASGSLSRVSASGTHTISHLTTAGNKHIPIGGASGQYLRYYSSGTATWNSISANEVTPRAFVVVVLSTTTYNWNVTTTRNIYDAIIGSGAISINVSTMASGEVGVCRFKTGASATNLVLSYTGGTVMIDSGANLNLSTNTEYVLTVVNTGESKLRFNLAKYVAV